MSKNIAAAGKPSQLSDERLSITAVVIVSQSEKKLQHRCSVVQILWNRVYLASWGLTFILGGHRSLFVQFHIFQGCLHQ